MGKPEEIAQLYGALSNTSNDENTSTQLIRGVMAETEGGQYERLSFAAGDLARKLRDDTTAV